jgi:hypothetical protein
VENLPSIIEGATNYVKKELDMANPEIEELFERRMAICSICENYGGSSCKLCGCNFQTKLRAINQTCPINKW